MNNSPSTMQKYRLSYRLQDGPRPGTFELDNLEIFDNYEEARNFILGLMGSEGDRPIQKLELEPYPKAKRIRGN